MNATVPALLEQARALAEAFDRGFAVARPAAPSKPSDYLIVRIGGDPHAVPLLELAELVPLPRLTALPGSPAECLGLAGVRGVAVPVYDLRVLLGYAAGGETAPWLAILAAARVALTFDAVEGYLRLPDEDVGAGTADDASARRHVRHALRAADTMMPVLDTGSLLAAIRSLAPRHPLRIDA